MVGHTGVLKAAIGACETADAAAGAMVDAMVAAGGAAIVTADHGNAEMMIDEAHRRPVYRAHDESGPRLARFTPQAIRSGGRRCVAVGDWPMSRRHAPSPPLPLAPAMAGRLIGGEFAIVRA